MLDILSQLLLFSAKTVIVLAFLLFLLIGIIAIVSHGKNEPRGKLVIKNLNEKYAETKEVLLLKMLSKMELKKYQKEKKLAEKNKKQAKNKKTEKHIFVLHFNGDIKASAVNALREEITAILAIAKKTDEVVICIESPGGMVHAYGLAAAQLSRLREKNIPLTVIVDKVAASGGYLMACIANKIIAAPFAIIGSIGVIVQLPNFHRLLKEKNIDFEQLTAGSYKRTLTVFGENTEEARDKLRSEIEEIHHLFKNLIAEHRPQLDINTVATGEHWLGKQALELQLVDHLQTSDDYLLENSKTATLYQLTYQTKKSFKEKISANAQILKNSLFGDQIWHI